MIRISVATIFRDTVCPYCKETLDHLDSVVCCVLCHTVHHDNCWSENQMHCSVFSCAGSEFRPKVQTPRRWLIAYHSLLNAALHYRIHLFGPVVDWLQVPHAFALLAIELLILSTGIFALTKSGFPGSWENSEDPWDPLALLTLSGNAAFILFLFYYLLSRGLETFLALVSL